MIRSFVGTCAIAFAIVPASFAADMPAGGRYLAPDFGPAFAWGGVYVGLYGGYGWGSSDWSGSAATGSVSPGGGLFGGTIGFNIQNGAFVYGLEGDVAGSWMRHCHLWERRERKLHGEHFPGRRELSLLVRAGADDRRAGLAPALFVWRFSTAFGTPDWQRRPVLITFATYRPKQPRILRG